MPDIVTVQLRFSVDTSLGSYSDTLSFTEDEWAKRDLKAIDLQKQAMADFWVSWRSQQIIDDEARRTDEGKQAQIAQIDAAIEELTATKEALASSISVVNVAPTPLTP
jgi:hypothetical protein